jgi:hypothetical protein
MVIVITTAAVTTTIIIITTFQSILLSWDYLLINPGFSGW